ncbi:14-3-3 domain-containing protein [Lasiosphaeria miniovina]|uniref:14-3-3 domain-containing protein n=1 Tax=Lasiosphaeria miniovina TaxID=1954250 RepID=A0AA40B689_9PEZI|nr:14-3-3 domain-containing protein [Lasiosphaeria miniovina]KAK0728078.1 14-3-3 domain-containing protein [Lasiosphaeria miniovina]
MASSEVDQKFLGKLAKAVENDNPLLAKVLFRILGLSINLSGQLVSARKQSRVDTARTADLLELHFHIIWLSREGLVLLEQYVLPMVGKYVELKVLAYKLRASFYHIFVLFHNTPSVSSMSLGTPEGQTSAAPGLAPIRLDKGKGVARDDEYDMGQLSLITPRTFEGGPVGPPPGFGPESPAAFLMRPGDYLPQAYQYFQEAVQYAETLLWGSHSLRLSVKTEYAAFLYECVHDTEGSRKVAKETITQAYEATEGIEDDMFDDTSELVNVLGRMVKRGLGTNNSRSPRSSPGNGNGNGNGNSKAQLETTSAEAEGRVPPGMI